MPNADYHYVYVLQSDIDRKFYVGYTTNLINRLRQHNSRRVICTRMRLPVRLVYWEGCLSQKDATTREKYLKTAWGKRYIKNRLKDYLTG
jgi:putative endonuclease